MTLKKTPMKDLKNGNTVYMISDEEFNYRYVDPMIPRLQRLQKWLKQASKGPVWINWEGYPKYNKDHRELVRKGALRLVRKHISTCRNMSMLLLTDKGKSMIK